MFVIVDNGSDHRGQAAIKRLRDAWPNAIMIHTPVHASWLNQAEIFFAIAQKKVLTSSDFASLEELAGTLLAFVDRYNQGAGHSTGSSPPQTWPGSSTGSAPTSTLPETRLARGGSLTTPTNFRSQPPSHTSSRGWHAQIRMICVPRSTRQALLSAAPSRRSARASIRVTWRDRRLP